MKINKKLLPIKAHFFFFMSAMGPILPQLSVYGKELGISSVVMGSITGVLPFVFLIAKPSFGMLVDVYRNYRKAIFMMLIVVMTVSYASMNFIPPRPLLRVHVNGSDDVVVDTCKVIDIESELQCSNHTTKAICTSKCFQKPQTFLLNSENSSFNDDYRLCTLDNPYQLNINNTRNTNQSCEMDCFEDIEGTSNSCLYNSYTFWSFVILMSIGTIGFNVVNSISDAICFDVIGEEYDYGKQRVWGTIGFGTTALLGGYIVDMFSGSTFSYTPAFVVMLVFCLLDLFACVKLKLPVMESPENIFKDLKKLVNNCRVLTFMTFAVFSGVVDGFIIYFLFWYVEDLAIATNTKNIKLIEGLIVAAETLGGEVIFFSISGLILDRFGHVHCFSMCFVNYALRLGLLSVAASPWWVLPIEFVFQGPTYALTYTTIVAYANEIAPPGASATMQGIAAGMDDGVGYAIGSIVGGLLYKYLGGRTAFQVFSGFALICSICHLLLHKTVLRNREPAAGDGKNYKSPEEAIKVSMANVS